MNLKNIQQWVKNKVSQYESDFDLLEEIERLVNENDKLKHHLDKSSAYCNELLISIAGKRIALIFITALLIVSLIGNAVQFMK